MGRKRRSNEEGAAAVEFAIVVTLLMLLVFGVIEFGLWIAKYEAMASAAREGARVAAVRSDVTGDNAFTSADVSAAVTQAAAPYAITGTPTADKTCNTSTYGQLVTVSWTQDMNIPNLFFRLPVLPASRLIKGVFRCESTGP